MTSWIVTIPNHLKTQEMCDEAVRKNSLSLAYVPGCFKTQEMYNEAVKNKLCMLLFVPDHFWTHEMCNEVIPTMPDVFHRIANWFETQEMYDKTVKEDSSPLQFVPDWFVKQEQIDLWDDDKSYEWHDDGKDKFFDGYDDEDNFFDQYEDYQKRKAQKASIKEELLRIVWHTSRYWDWCMTVDEKQRIKKLRA